MSCDTKKLTKEQCKSCAENNDITFNTVTNPGSHDPEGCFIKFKENGTIAELHYNPEVTSESASCGFDNDMGKCLCLPSLEAK